MTSRTDVDDGPARRPEVIAEIEAGNDVVIARGRERVATIKAEPSPPDREAVAAAIEEIERIRRGIAPTTVEDILAWRDEGRR